MSDEALETSTAAQAGGGVVVWRQGSAGMTSNSSARRTPTLSNNPERRRESPIELQNNINPHGRDLHRNANEDRDRVEQQINVHVDEQDLASSSICRCKVSCVCGNIVEPARSVRTEHTILQRRDLDILDVAALIINKQIGTGIFTTPGLVLSLTGSKTISTVLWFCGGIWAFLSVIIYVEFGSAFPFNGGELIYLDETFKSPDLLATILFSTFFIIIPNTVGNPVQFAKHVLLTANPDVTNTTELDGRLVTFLAITVLTIVCFIHYFSRDYGLILNLLLALYKIILVIVIIIGGAIASAQPDNGRSDWGDQNLPDKNIVAALIYIIYSYQGWENANYVGGELKVERKALKWGAFLAVSITTVLYTSVTIIYSMACPFGDLAGQDLGVVANFAPKAFGSAGAQGIKICIAISALGNLIAVVYTSARVKQQIARQCVMPFYRFFALDDKQFMTPMGALILQWLFGLIWISATPNTSGGYGFIIGLYIYGQLVVGVFVGFAFFWIKATYEADNARKDPRYQSIWHPVILKSRILRIISALVFIGMNFMVLIESARSDANPPAWLWPAVISSVLAGGSIYWFILWNIAQKSDENSPLEIRIVRDGSLIRDEDKHALQEAKVEMNSRVVIYETHGKLNRILTGFEVNLYKFMKLITR